MRAALHALGWIVATIVVGVCGIALVVLVGLVTLIGMSGLFGDGPLWQGLGVLPICFIIGGGILSSVLYED